MSVRNLRIWLSALGLWLLGAAAAQASSGGGHGGDHAVNWVYVVSLLVNFLGFTAFLVFLLRKPVAGFFAGRAEEVRTRLAAADRAREQAEAKAREYQCKIEELVSTREEVMTQSRAEADYEKERILDQARRQAERLLKDAERSIVAEAEKATRGLTTEAVKAIVEEAERLLTRAATPDDTVRLADDYIESIREVKRA